MSEAMVTIYLAVLGGVVAVGLSVAVYFIWKRVATGGKKPLGRTAMAGPAVQALRGFARSNSFRFIHPATLESGGKAAALDAVAVGYFGVLGVISLGYNGTIYGTAGDEEWLQVAEDGTRTRFANPTLEAAACVRVVRDALFNQKLKKVPVEVVCVFTNPKAQLALPRSVEYLTVKDFKAMLKKDKYLNDTGLDLDAVEGALRQALKA